MQTNHLALGAALALVAACGGTPPAATPADADATKTETPAATTPAETKAAEPAADATPAADAKPHERQGYAEGRDRRRCVLGGERGEVNPASARIAPGPIKIV